MARWEPGELPDGSLLGADGVAYRQTPERLKRRSASELVAAGAPVVTDVYPEGRTWHDGADAIDIWAAISPRLMVGSPPPVRDLQWVGRVWRSDDGEPLLVFTGSH